MHSRSYSTVLWVRVGLSACARTRRRSRSTSPSVKRTAAPELAPGPPTSLLQNNMYDGGKEKNRKNPPAHRR